MQDTHFQVQAVQSHTVQYQLHLKVLLELKLTVRKAEAA